MLADESEFETKFDSAVENIERMKKEAAKHLISALKYLNWAEKSLIDALRLTDMKETANDFNEIMRLEVKLEDIGCDLRAQRERMK